MDQGKILEENRLIRLKGLKHLIGNTPLLEIRFKFKGKERRLFIKSENLNMIGSIKDRMALFREEPIKAGHLSPEIELLDFKAHKRVCHTCCDMYDCTQHLSFNI